MFNMWSFKHIVCGNGTLLWVILLPLLEPLAVGVQEVDEGELGQRGEREEEADQDVDVQGRRVSHLRYFLV
jgi:hypothetical protein